MENVKLTRLTIPEIVPTAQYELITPEIAAEYLVKNTRNYRKLSQSKVSVLTRELIAGEWLPSTQGIGFDTDDVMVDGQHRLWAIVQTKIPVMMLVCRGLVPVVKDKIDVGNKRTFGDLTGLPNVVIAAVRVPFRAVLSGNGRGGLIDGKRASTTDLTFMREYLFGKLGKLNEEMAEVCRSTQGILNVGIRAAIALSIINGTCSKKTGMNIFNTLVFLRQNARGVYVNASLLEREEAEKRLPLLLRSLIKKIEQGITPIYDNKSGTYYDVKETPRELATKLMFLTMQALDSNMNTEENFVSPCHATVVETLNLK
jgi:hypothetical protein